MNILVATPWDQIYGGVPSVVGNLAIQWKQAGHHTWFLHPSDDDSLRAIITTWGFPGYQINLRSPIPLYDETGPIGGGPVKTMAAFWGYLGWTLLCLYRLISKHRIDIVNIHYPSEYYVYFGVLKRLCRFKLVLSIHGADVFPNGNKLASYSWAFRFLMRSADLLVTPSQGMLEDTLTIFPELRTRAQFIHNGLNVEDFELGALPQKAGSNSILCVAMHSHRKAIDVLIKAFEALHRTHPDLHLVLAGDGPLRNKLEQLGRDLGVYDRVRFLGIQTREEIKALMRQCAVFVLPSRAEPFGIAILEALASGKPVVATAVGGIPEIIQHGVTGLLVEPDNPQALSEAIKAVLNDQALANRLAQNGHNHVLQQFRWEDAAAKYDSAFRSLLLNKPAISHPLMNDKCAT
jgi:glycosyltransferase involved in cell wall biosynthesis